MSQHHPSYAAGNLTDRQAPDLFLSINILIEQYASIDFAFSWRTYRHRWELDRRIFWTYQAELIPIRLPREGWDLIQTLLMNEVLQRIQE